MLVLPKSRGGCLDVRQSQTPCCGRREAKGQWLFVACDDQDSRGRCHAASKDATCMSGVVGDDRRGKQKGQKLAVHLGRLVRFETALIKLE